MCIPYYFWSLPECTSYRPYASAHKAGSWKPDWECLEIKKGRHKWAVCSNGTYQQPRYSGCLLHTAWTRRWASGLYRGYLGEQSGDVTLQSFLNIPFLTKGQPLNLNQRKALLFSWALPRESLAISMSLGLRLGVPDMTILVLTIHTLWGLNLFSDG